MHNAYAQYVKVLFAEVYALDTKQCAFHIFQMYAVINKQLHTRPIRSRDRDCFSFENQVSN